MKWLIVATMAFTYQSGAKDYYVWPEPAFDSMEQCKAWGSVYREDLVDHLAEVYGVANQVEMISCVDLNIVNQILAKNILPNQEF